MGPASVPFGNTGSLKHKHSLRWPTAAQEQTPCGRQAGALHPRGHRLPENECAGVWLCVQRAQRGRAQTQQAGPGEGAHGGKCCAEPTSLCAAEGPGTGLRWVGRGRLLLSDSGQLSQGRVGASSWSGRGSPATSQVRGQQLAHKAGGRRVRTAEDTVGAAHREATEEGCALQTRTRRSWSGPNGTPTLRSRGTPI